MTPRSPLVKLNGYLELHWGILTDVIFVTSHGPDKPTCANIDSYLRSFSNAGRGVFIGHNDSDVRLIRNKNDLISAKYFFNLSQEEINAINKELEHAIVFGSGVTHIEIDPQSDLFSVDPKQYQEFKGCEHKWVDYQGLNESFKFCELCDRKQE